MKTCARNEYPLKHHFNIVKLRATGVYLPFLFLLWFQNIDCGYSLEPPRHFLLISYFLYVQIIYCIFLKFSSFIFVTYYPVTFFCDIYPIRKTCPCNEYTLEPHFYIAKLGYGGVYLFFLFLLQNIDCGYSLEPPRRGGSNVYPQYMF